MIEIGIPFSDPMADGPVIQKSNQTALKNGMNLKLLFRQLENIRKEVNIPLILMGYLNPVIQFGVEEFCSASAASGIDGVILPDLPPLVYTEEYSEIFNKFNLYNILLVSPQSSPERISFIDNISKGFIYIVSSSSVTGKKGVFSQEQISYFKRVNGMGLKNPTMIGFGISDRETFLTAGKYARGGIIGSAFLNSLSQSGSTASTISDFIKKFKG
jgi:tryptophan synthase alpha chain